MSFCPALGWKNHHRTSGKVNMRPFFHPYMWLKAAAGPHIENLSKIYRKSIENLSKIHRKSIEHLSNIYRKSIENLSKTYRRATRRKSIDNLSKLYRKSIENLSKIYGSMHLSDMILMIFGYFFLPDPPPMIKGGRASEIYGRRKYMKIHL